MFKTQENSPPSLTVAKLGTPTPAARCWVTTCCTAQIDTHILTWVCWLRLPTKPPERTINCCGEGFAATNCVLFDHDRGIPTVCRGIKTRLMVAVGPCGTQVLVFVLAYHIHAKPLAPVVVLAVLWSVPLVSLSLLVQKLRDQLGFSAGCPAQKHETSIPGSAGACASSKASFIPAASVISPRL